MATSVHRKKLSSLISRLLGASLESCRVAENCLVRLRTETPVFSKFETCKQSFSFRGGGRTCGRADSQPQADEGTGNSSHHVHRLFQLESLVSGEAIETCKFGGRHRKISVSETGILRQSVDRSLLRHLCTAPVNRSSVFRDGVAPIQLLKKLSAAYLHPLPEPTSARSSAVKQKGSEFGSGLEIRLQCQDFPWSIRTSHELLESSNATPICQKSDSSSSVTYHVSGNCEKTEPAISGKAQFLSASYSHGARFHNSFPLTCSLHSCLHSTSNERVLSDSKKDGNNSSRQEDAAVLGSVDGSRAGNKIWIRRVIPERLWPFAQLARLDKPIGTWLLAWPCFWSICLAAPSGSLPDLEMLGWFGLGSILLRGAGCTVNDLLDSDIDGKVERTQLRPIASGILTHFHGVCFLGCQLLLGLGVLLQLNDFSRILGASSLLLVGTYPLMKRWTFWPQAYLGLAFNWGALLGWAAVHGSLDPSIVLPLYASGVCWTLVYDTIYAHQDKEDDVKVGVKSTALRFGNNTQIWLTGFSTLCVSGLTLTGFNASLGWPFYAGMAATAGHLAWQVFSVDIQNRADCNSKFVSNKWFGAIVCSAIVVGKVAA